MSTQIYVTIISGGERKTVAFVSRVITTCFLKKMSIESSLLSEMRKIELLDIEQIILDLNVSTYISLIHPLNPCCPTPNSNSVRLSKKTCLSEVKIQKKTNPVPHPCGKWPQWLDILPQSCFHSSWVEKYSLLIHHMKLSMSLLILWDPTASQ